MKHAKLLLLSLFVGSLVAHPQGLIDRLLWHRVERLAGKGAPVVRTFKLNDNALIDMLPEYELAQIPLPKGEHTHVTAATVAKVTAFLVALKLNINEAITKAAKRNSGETLSSSLKTHIRNKVLLRTGLDMVKDYVVDGVQDKITDNLPASITERKVHPMIKWAAAQAGNAALGVAYDATAGRVIKAGFRHFRVNV